MTLILGSYITSVGQTTKLADCKALAGKVYGASMYTAIQADSLDYFATNEDYPKALVYLLNIKEAFKVNKALRLKQIEKGCLTATEIKEAREFIKEMDRLAPVIDEAIELTKGQILRDVSRTTRGNASGN